MENLCLIAVVNSICPEKTQFFSNICLSSGTITRQIQELSDDVKFKQGIQIEKSEHFSMCLDESTDVTHTA